MTCRLENFPIATKSRVSMGGTGKDQEKESKWEDLSLLAQYSCRTDTTEGPRNYHFT